MVFGLVRDPLILVRDVMILSRDLRVLVRDVRIRIRKRFILVRDPFILSADPRVLVKDRPIPASPKTVPSFPSRVLVSRRLEEVRPRPGEVARIVILTYSWFIPIGPSLILVTRTDIPTPRITVREAERLPHLHSVHFASRSCRRSKTAAPQRTGQPSAFKTIRPCS